MEKSTPNCCATRVRVPAQGSLPSPSKIMSLRDTTRHMAPSPACVMTGRKTKKQQQASVGQSVDETLREEAVDREAAGTRVGVGNEVPGDAGRMQAGTPVEDQAIENPLLAANLLE
jgi:hypothetical protein